jgi:hypothetical protein
MNKRLLIVWHSVWFALLAVWLMAGSAFGHHGWNHYDANKTLNLSGVIKESSYSNPHGLIRLQVDGANGKTWLAVLAPPSRMNSRGLSQEMLKVGTTATVVGYPHRESTDEMRAERIAIEGKMIDLR